MHQSVPNPLKCGEYVKERSFLVLQGLPWNAKEPHEGKLSHPKQVVRKTVDEASSGPPVYSIFRPEK